MNNTISEILKKLTICTMVLIFSFILLAPTADALNYDPRKNPPKYTILPSGDDDPFGVDKVNENTTYTYNPFIYYWNLFVIKAIIELHIIDIEKERYEPESDTETPRSTLVQSSNSGS